MDMLLWAAGVQGQMVFGSQMVERSLAVYCQVAEAHYHTTKVYSPLPFAQGNPFHPPGQQ